MRTLPLFLLLLAFFFPSFSALAASESCAEEDMSCECTDDEGDALSLNDESLTDGDLCKEACAGNASYAFYCGTSRTPVDSGSIEIDTSSSSSEEGEEISIPALNVPIPGLNLEGSVTVDDEGNVVTNMIGLYVNAVFSYAITLAALFGVLMLMIAGFQYMTAGGNKSAVTKAKGRMQNTLLGLVLLMATYAIAFLIDPRLTWFAPLSIEVVDRIDYVDKSGSIPGNITFNPPDDILCSGSYSVETIVSSMKGKITYRMGGKGGPPPYSSLDMSRSPTYGELYKDFCPEGQVCLDCNGFVDYVLACADLETSKSLGTEAIFQAQHLETISQCTGTSVNGTALHPGDLISIAADNGVTVYGHVWIYIGNGQVAESYGIGKEGNALAVSSLQSQCSYWRNQGVPLHVLRLP